MMKKVIIAIISIVLVIALAVGGFFIVKKTKDKDKADEPYSDVEIIDENIKLIQKSEYSSVMRVSSVDELKQTAQSCGLELQTIDDEFTAGYTLKGISVGDIDIDFVFETNDENELTDIYAKYTPFSEPYDNEQSAPHTGEEVKDKFDLFLSAVSSLFGTTVGEDDYYIVENDIIDNTADSFAKVYAMTAYLDCVLKDENSLYWIITMQSTEDLIPYFQIHIDLNDENYDSDRVAYVDLSYYYVNADRTMSDEEMESQSVDGDGNVIEQW